MGFARTSHAGIIAATLAIATLLTGCGPTSFLITPVQNARDLHEFEVARDSVWASKRIAMIEVEGVITEAAESSLLGGTRDNPLAVFKNKLDLAEHDDTVKAVVLRINSPGGGVTASDIMYRELKGFRERSGKPIIACMMDVAASGGYYIACAADRIYAHTSTVTGSIGVIMMTPDLSGTMVKIGARMNVIKSGDLKDAGSPFREMNERDRAVFEGLINSMYENFLSVVHAGRPAIAADKLRTLADGRVYTAAQAKDAGLIDEIGTVYDAIDAAKRASGLTGKDVVVVQYGYAYAYKPNVYATSTMPEPTMQSNASIVNVELPSWLHGGPRFMYLWAP